MDSHARPRQRGGQGRTALAVVVTAALSAALAAGGTALALNATGDDTAGSAASARLQPDSPATDDGTGTTAGSDTDDAPRVVAGEGVDWRAVAEAAQPSVVSIGIQGATGRGGQGSGVVVDDDGHVVTNNHVVAGAAGGGQVAVTLRDGRVLEAELVGTDPATDLAVLRLLSAPDDLRPIVLGDSDAVRVGDPVMALGNPLGLSDTATTGIVSAVDRPVTTENASASPFEPGLPVVTNAIQTDAAVNPGNSGGALVDASGRLVGINSSIATLGSGGGSGSIGLGFAIPVNQARWVTDRLVDTGRVEHAFLGVTPVDAVVEADGVRRQAAGVADVVPDTPAATAGLVPGEAVLAVDGEPVSGAQPLVAQVREREPGTTVVLSVVDAEGTSRDVEVRFGVRPTG